MSKLDKAMVFWMCYHFVSLMVEAVSDWEEVDTLPEANWSVWKAIPASSDWYTAYMGMDFMFEEMPFIRRECSRILAMVFAEVCDNAKK